MSEINKRLANVLLHEKGLTPYLIHQQTGFSLQSISNWLKGKRGKYQMPAADSVAKLCVIYKLDVEYIMLGKERNEVKQKSPTELMQETITVLMSEVEFLKSLHKKK